MIVLTPGGHRAPSPEYEISPLPSPRPASPPAPPTQVAGAAPDAPQDNPFADMNLSASLPTRPIAPAQQLPALRSRRRNTSRRYRFERSRRRRSRSYSRSRSRSYSRSRSRRRRHRRRSRRSSRRSHTPDSSRSSSREHSHRRLHSSRSRRITQERSRATRESRHRTSEITHAISDAFASIAPGGRVSGRQDFVRIILGRTRPNFMKFAQYFTSIQIPLEDSVYKKLGTAAALDLPAGTALRVLLAFAQEIRAALKACKVRTTAWDDGITQLTNLVGGYAVNENSLLNALHILFDQYWTKDFARVKWASTFQFTQSARLMSLMAAQSAVSAAAASSSSSSSSSSTAFAARSQLRTLPKAKDSKGKPYCRNWHLRATCSYRPCRFEHGCPEEGCDKRHPWCNNH